MRLIYQKKSRCGSFGFFGFTIGCLASSGMLFQNSNACHCCILFGLFALQRFAGFLQLKPCRIALIYDGACHLATCKPGLLDHMRKTHARSTNKIHATSTQLQPLWLGSSPPCPNPKPLAKPIALSHRKEHLKKLLGFWSGWQWEQCLHKRFLLVKVRTNRSSKIGTPQGVWIHKLVVRMQHDCKGKALAWMQEPVANQWPTWSCCSHQALPADGKDQQNLRACTSCTSCTSVEQLMIQR